MPGWVAPFTGAWIEIIDKRFIYYNLRGVAPFTGAWIEIKANDMERKKRKCRTLHGCVD